MASGRRTLAIVIGIIGLLALAAGVVYLAVPAHSLPSFIPGHISGKHGGKSHSKRGAAGVALGIVLLAVSIGMTVSSRRRRHRW